jgi:hypothetical protein
MTPEQRKALDKLLVEDAQLVKELRSLGGGAEDGATHLLAYVAERIKQLKVAIGAEHSKAREKRYWAERAEWERKALATAKPQVYPGRDAVMPYAGPK